MTAYYNEIDPLKAETLRVAIRACAIAPGDVDDRSIKDVSPEDLLGYTQCHFFAGGGFWSLALRLAGWPDDRPVWTGSCPCPSFSAAGKGEGFDDPRHLWPDWSRLIGQRRPPAIFGEQASAAIGFGWLDLVQSDLEAASYSVGKAVLGACCVGGSDIRKRLYFMAHSEVSGWEERGQNDVRGGERGSSERMEQRFRDGGIRCVMAHSTSERQLGGRIGDEGKAARYERESTIGGLRGRKAEKHDTPGILGVSEGQGLQERFMLGGVQPEADGTPAGQGFERGSHPGGLADTHGGDSCAEGIQRGGEYRQFAEDGGASELDRCGSRRDGDHGRDERIISGATGEDGGSSPLNGPWRDADWLLCRDGKWRPVKPGAFPLAHGYPNRVGLLRLAGDAINVEVAKTFIEEAKGVIDEIRALQTL